MGLPPGQWTFCGCLYFVLVVKQPRTNLMRAAAFMRFVITCAVCLLSLRPGMAQESATLPSSAAAEQTAVAATAIPDAPTPAPAPQAQQDPPPSTSTSASAAATSQDGGQTKRILWIMPNFRAVNAGVKLPPQSVKEKPRPGLWIALTIRRSFSSASRQGLVRPRIRIRHFTRAPPDTADIIAHFRRQYG